MTDYNRPDDGNLDLLKTSDGTTLSANQSGASSTFGCTLVNGATYVLPLGAATAPMPSQTGLVSVHLKWAAAVAAVITVETCNFPRHIGNRTGTGPDDTLDWSTTTGDWIQENPSTAYVAVVGTGNSVSALTITAGGTNAGGATIHLGNFGTRRVRLKIVVTTGGLMRLGIHGKLGA